MSGRATGWVLANGPTPATLDADGAAYGPAKARLLRSVLIVIADASNADGRHAHPGNDGIAAASLYGRRSVSSAVAALVADGWVEIEEAGGGRGKATVYRVLLDRVNRANGAPIPEAKPRDPEPETARSEPETARSHGARPTVVTTELPNGTTAAPAAPSPRKKPRRDDDVTATADRLARGEWERRTRKPVCGFVAMRERIVDVLDAGWPEADVARVLPSMTVWSRAAFDLVLGRLPSARARRAHVERRPVEESGRVDPVEELRRAGRWPGGEGRTG